MLVNVDRRHPTVGGARGIRTLLVQGPICRRATAWPAQLTPTYSGTWSIRISGNWHITFKFEDGNAYDVNLEDYH